MWSTRVCQCDEFVQGNDYLCAVCRLLPPAPVRLQTTQAPSDAGQVLEMKNPFTNEKQTFTFKTGETLSIAGNYKRRTFWQWLTRRPRELKTFIVGDNVTTEN